MSDQPPSIHIDTDWKKQAQEEKRRLAEQEKARAAAGSAATATAPSGTTAREAAPRGVREMPPASFATLVSSLMTQALLYLGDLAPRGGEPVVNLDLAKHHIDTLGILEQKTEGHLSPEEKRLLDTALYEVRNRYVSVASQYIT